MNQVDRGNVTANFVTRKLKHLKILFSLAFLAFGMSIWLFYEPVSHSVITEHRMRHGTTKANLLQ
jgi:hypothetical protein